MENNKENFKAADDLNASEAGEVRYEIEADSDSLEPFVDEHEHRIINADDPKDLANWAQQFQLSIADLKAAIVLNGNAVKDIKRYLSV